MLAIFEAQTRNVQRLSSARRILNRSLNEALVSKNDVEVGILTKMLCVAFSCWAEARFSKLVHTPNGFSENEINQIRLDHNGRERSIEDRWSMCISTALSKVPAARRSSEKPNTQLRLERIVQDYVVVPSKLRNKIAHGQWEIALNRDNSAENENVTAEIALLDFIQIELWFSVFDELAHIVENMIESPGRTYRRDYWYHIDKVQHVIEERKNWTVKTKQDELILKRKKAAKKWRSELQNAKRV